MSERPKLPCALYSCHICADDYSWPAEDLYWSDSISQWLCETCWDDEAHGQPAVRMDREIKAQNADLRAKLADAERERDEAKTLLTNWTLEYATNGTLANVYIAERDALKRAVVALAGALEAQKATLDEWYQPAPDWMTKPISDARAKIVTALADATVVEVLREANP